MLRTLCDEGFAGEIGFLNYARSSATRAVWRRARELADRAPGAARRPRLHARRGPAARRALLPRALRAVDLRARRCGDLRLRPAGADRRRPRRMARRTAARAAAVETFTPPALSFDSRRRRGLRQLRRQRTRGRQQRPAAARAGRGRRARARVRLPDGHLQHVQLPQDGGRRAQRPHRRDLRRAGRGADPHLRVACPSATSRSTSEPRPSRRSQSCPHPHPVSPPEQLEALRPGARRDPRPRRRRPRRARRRLHQQGHPRPARAGGRRPRPAVPRLPAARLDRRHRRAVAVEDPRQHGDRPQRHARPVRLDERPAAERQDASSGTPPAPATSGATRTTTCTTPTPTSSARTATSATGSCGCPRTSAWSPYYLGNPLYAALLAIFFQYGVALHDLETERIAAGETSLGEKREHAARHLAQGARPDAQGLRAVPAAVRALAPVRACRQRDGEPVRNLWAFTIIFCGHFPDGAHEFTEEEAENETRGQWYYRQLLGSANLTGGKLFHILAGNLSFQIEHHLFPDLPAHRYAEISVEVREICERYGSALQHRPAAQAVRQRRAQDRQARAAADPRPRSIRARQGQGRS